MHIFIFNIIIYNFKYWKGAMLKGDYLEDSVRKLNTCIVRFSTSQQKDSQTVTEQINSSSEAEATQFELEIPCPKAKIYGGDCSNSDCHWECDECAQLIVFKKPKNVCILIIIKLIIHLL